MCAFASIYCFLRASIMSDEVIQGIKKAEKTGKEQYRTFVDERMMKMTKPFHDTIPKNNFTMFQSGQKKALSKSKAKVSCLKRDLQLFSRMYISCRARECGIGMAYSFSMKIMLDHPFWLRIIGGGGGGGGGAFQAHVPHPFWPRCGCIPIGK